jgi:hypothetical protein
MTVRKRKQNKRKKKTRSQNTQILQVSTKLPTENSLSGSFKFLPNPRLLPEDTVSPGHATGHELGKK